MALFPDVKIDFMKCISESQSLRLQMGPSLIPLEEGRPLKHSARARRGGQGDGGGGVEVQPQQTRTQEKRTRKRKMKKKKSAQKRTHILNILIFETSASTFFDCSV